MNATKVLAVFAVLAFVSAPVQADWYEGEPYKMHYPQLPDPFGWDVSFTHGPLGDDWECSETGPVNDIHIWVSFRENYVPSAAAVVGGIVEIWSNVPAGVDEPWSHPGQPLWGMDFDTNMPNVKLIPYGTGDQGWYDPVQPIVIPSDHQMFWQLNIDPVDRPAFTQKRGEIYWLVAHMFVDDPTGTVPVEIGWKTSRSELFMDDGVYRSATGAQWLPLFDPLSPIERSLDLAFVITVPEPVSAVLLVLGVVGVLAISRRGN